MAIYIFYWLVFSLFSFIEIFILKLKSKRLLHKSLIVIFVISLIFLIGLRWNTGTDWLPYKSFFEWTYTKGFFESDPYMDYGYVLFNNFCYFLSNNYTVLLVIHAAVFYILMYKNLKAFTPYIILCLFIYTANNFGMIGSNRQLLAVAVGIFSVVNYYNRKYYLSIVFFIAAVLFHNTAVLILIFPFLNKRLTLKHLIFIILIALSLSRTGLVEIAFTSLGSFNEASQGKVDAYLDYVDDYKGLSIIGIFRRVAVLITFFYFSEKLRKNFKYFDVIYNSYLITVISFVVFSTVPIIAGRGMLYFNFSESILFTYLLSLTDNKKIKNIILLLLLFMVIALFFQSINLYPDLFIPYEGIFINSRLNRQTY